MAQHNISKFTSEPGKLVDLLSGWNERHRKLYRNKRAALAEWRKDRATNAVDGEVDPQWPNWRDTCLRTEYLSDIKEVCIASHPGPDYA